MTVIPCDRPGIPRMDVTDGVDKAYDLLHQDGCVIIKNFISPEMVARLNDDFDREIPQAKGGFRAEEKEKFSVKVDEKTVQLPNPLMMSKTFRDDIMNNAFMHAIWEKAYRKDCGDYCMLQSTIFQLNPGACAQNLHRDEDTMPLAKYLPPDGPHLTVSFLIALTEFREDNGATQVVPRSSAFPHKPTFDEYRDQAVTAEMQPGDVLLFHGRTVHGGGHNRSQETRRGLNMIAQPCYLAIREVFWDAPREIIESMTPLAQKMIGWRCVTNSHGMQYNLTRDIPFEEAINLKSAAKVQ